MRLHSFSFSTAIVSAFAVASCPRHGHAESPVPDTTTPGDKAAIARKEIGGVNCQDRGAHPCMISTNTEYHVHASGEELRDFNFRFSIPESTTVAIFRYTSNKNTPSLDIAYSDDMTEYVHEIMDFPTTSVVYPFKVGHADPDTPRSHNYYGRLVPTDYLITIRDFPSGEIDFKFKVEVGTQ